MPDSESVQPSSRRRSTHRQRHRRQVRKRIISGVLAGVLVVLAALWFSDTLRIPTDGPRFAGGVVIKAQGTDKPGAVQSVQPAHRDLNPLQPMKLWIGGDSLAGALGPALGDMTAATGVVQPQYDFRVGSGLMSGDIDWQERGQQQMDEVNPEVVVFIIGTNDAQVFADRDAAKYEELTEKMMRTLVGDGAGREVYWVNAPVMKAATLEMNVRKIDEIQRRVAQRVSGVKFVDAHTLFADENGDYLSQLPDETGDKVTMRAGDGIHLTSDGAKHLARAVYALMDPVWRISDQAVVGQTKKVVVSEDSDSPYGGSGGSGSSGSGSGSSSNRSYSNGSSNDGNSSSGTTPTTSAPVEAPPPPETQPPVASTAPTTAPTTPPASSP